MSQVVERLAHRRLRARLRRPGTRRTAPARRRLRRLLPQRWRRCCHRRRPDAAAGRAATSSSPVDSTATRGRPHHVDRAHTAGRQHADLARADLRAARAAAFRRARCPSRHRRRIVRVAAARRSSIAGAVLDELGVLDHHHGVGAARNGAAGRDRGRGAGRHLDRGRDAAGDHLGVKRKPLRRAVAGADRIGGAHGEAVDIGAVERRHIDRRDHVGGKHARQRGAQRLGFGRQRRAVDAGRKTATRFRRRDHFEKLLLPRRAPHRIEDRRGVRLLFRIYGHGFTATCVPAGNPSLSAGTTIQPSLRATAVSDR